VRSSDSRIYIRFKSNAVGQFPGFSLQYSASVEGKAILNKFFQSSEGGLFDTMTSWKVFYGGFRGDAFKAIET